MRKTILLVLILALLSFVASLIILFSRLGGSGAELANRGTLSAAVSGVFAVLLGIIAIIVTTRVSSSDYRAEEDVKTQTAQLLACLRSIIMKGVNLSQKPTAATTRLTFAKEKELINSFLCSTTAFAYWSWQGHKSELALSGKEEEWRVFFMYLIDILDSDDASDFSMMVGRAVSLEKLLTELGKHDIGKISRYVSNLSGAVGAFRESREKSVIIKAVSEIHGQSQSSDQLRRKLLHLKKKGISDPNVDLFLAVLDPAGGDTALARAALEAGADRSMTDGQLLAKYESQLLDYRDMGAS